MDVCLQTLSVVVVVVVVKADDDDDAGLIIVRGVAVVWLRNQPVCRRRRRLSLSLSLSVPNTPVWH